MEPLTADDPRQVSVFRLQARLGAGGMGRVYLGSSPGGRAVAVKVVHPELARDPEFMARFRREAEAAASVGGVYTAPVVGAGPGDSPPWLATAYVPGPSLAELVHGSGPLPEEAVWRLAGGLTEALQAIHDCGLVHRDLKPGNVLIAADGPRVIDFGISRALHGTALTGTGGAIGTPAYMSPEQAAGRAVGPGSDVFSLGSVLAFAATGTAPFEGGPPLAAVYRIVHDEPDLSGLPPALARLVRGCLAKDPADRPSVASLLAAVTAAAASFPPSAPGRYWPGPLVAAVTALAASGPFPASAPPVATPPSVPAAGATAQPGGLRPLTPPDQPPPGRPPAPWPQGRRPWLLLGGAATAAAAAGTVLALVIMPGQAVRGTAGQSSRTATGTTAPPSVTTSAAGATGAATTTSPPTAALVTTVTVCADPGTGCQVPSATQYMEIKPTEIVDSGDGSGTVRDLVWTDWGSPVAHATGTQEVDNCQPDCATGTEHPYPATVIVEGLTSYGTGLEAYATIVIQSTDGGPSSTYNAQTTIPS